MKRISICLVEDDKEISNTLQLLLADDQDFDFKFAYADGESAIKEIPDDKPDVVLMDIHLPGISGIECVRALKEKCPGTQFMMNTIYEDDENIFEALKAGASGYILKRTPFNELVAAIRELHGGGSPMNSQIARRVVAFVQQMSPRKSKDEALLTAREKEILNMLSKGLRYKEVAKELFISPGTVRTHVQRIYEKLHVQSRMEAVNKIFNR